MESIKTSLSVNFASRFLIFAQQKKYEILLLSFLLLIFGNTFIYRVKIFEILNIYQNILTGLVVFSNRSVIRLLIVSLLLFSLGLEVFQSLHPFAMSRSLHSGIYLTFFTIVSIEVFKALLYSKTITRELLSAALCGFVLLCMISTFLFYEIESSHPHSFSNIGADPLTDCNYFSFITLLTIGYGDITPLTLAAKRSVMLIGFVGHFYTVFITSIIIGKYLSSKQK